MSILAPEPPSITPDHPPGKEIGAVSQTGIGIPGWSSFVDDAEYVPKLRWPQSVWTYHEMRSHSQIEALYLGTVQPIREFRWSVDPNKAPAALVEQLASDLGLPIKGQEDDAIQRGPRTFDFDLFLDDALLGLLYGFMHHEIVGEIRPDGWHMVKLAPRHPRTISDIRVDGVGDLEWIRQHISQGGTQGQKLPEPIPAQKLVTHVWRSEAGSPLGRSMLRPMYLEYLVRDRVIRVGAINLERGGGTPVVYGAQGASDAQLKDLANMARQFKSSEAGGGALPFGSKLELHGASVPDAVAFLEYCDNCMARVWSLMLIQLGLTAGGSGNRALGGEFALYAARAQRAVAKWVCRSMNLFFDDYVSYNSANANYAPLLHFEQEKPDSLSILELTTLIEAQALHVDPELESWIRGEYGLPKAPDPQVDPELGDLTPEEVALVHSSRNPPALPATAPQPPGLPAGQDIGIGTPALASSNPLTGAWTVPLPARNLRRLPTEIEARSKTDFRSMDAAHATVVADVQNLMSQSIIPEQITALGEQIDKAALTKTAMAKLAAPTVGADEIKLRLLDAARQGAHAAAAELSAQNVTAEIPTDETLGKLIGDQATAVAEMAANGLSLAAQRRAQALVGGGRSSTELRTQVESSLHGMKHQWTMDQLNGAVQLAQNAGRGATFGTADQQGMTYYASELLDENTCEPCSSIDGTEYASLDDALADYAGGGYVDCDGGPRCRGTIVATGPEPDPTSDVPTELVDAG